MSRLLAAVYDRVTEPAEEACVREWRSQLLRNIAGEVLEIGAGTGHNLPHYSDSVRRLTLAEPDRHMRVRLERKVADVRPPFPVEISDAGAEQLPFDDTSFDAVVATLVLCSVDSPETALSEIRRVLRRGGRLAFLEHVAAVDRPRRYRWQRRVEPVWRRLADGCHLTRDTESTIRHAGFEVEDITRESMRRAMPLVRPSIRGVARVPE